MTEVDVNYPVEDDKPVDVNIFGVMDHDRIVAFGTWDADLFNIPKRINAKVQVVVGRKSMENTFNDYKLIDRFRVLVDYTDNSNEARIGNVIVSLKALRRAIEFLCSANNFTTGWKRALKTMHFRAYQGDNPELPIIITYYEYVAIIAPIMPEP